VIHRFLCSKRPVWSSYRSSFLRSRDAVTILKDRFIPRCSQLHSQPDSNQIGSEA
jgi:hypothetical protein